MSTVEVVSTARPVAHLSSTPIVAGVHTSVWRRFVQALFAVVVRVSAPWTWRTRRRAVEKLLGFAATEHGSAKDMLRAAWLDDVPARRRLFLVHALDEFRHADLFRAAANALEPAHASDGRSAGARVAAARMQGLFVNNDARGFLSFVEDAEERGLAHFSALATHFAQSANTTTRAKPANLMSGTEHARLSALFDEVANDERFHVQYSGRLLARHDDDGKGRLVHVGARVRAFGQAWRRSGRSLGDRCVHVALWCFVLTVFPLFALVAWRERAMRAQLLPGARGAVSLDDERRALTQQL
jgi:hypothetical protein